MVKLLAPEIFWTVSEDERGGCGPGRWGDYVVPDSLFWCDIRPACSIHDFMWAIAICNFDIDYKYHADFLFLINMRKLINKQKPHTPGFITRLRLWLAKYYFERVWDYTPRGLRRD